ncbi:phage tail terminator protein [Methylobrevis pamukkalensis]|uniref:Uncharacterized protein n=1 Tax=Methylobrevis pamukkalensis TaxID=1439726 RepID=A0A1E3H499_9HYPH|nr:hypothetical protein [Methylobrevis pamukkalensis]ODN71177.1 hypothetical protein A6302_01466 [Methylobrevis pamukkalensis]
MIGLVVDRLIATAAPPLLSVEAAENLDALGKGTAARHGAAFVIPMRERASANRFAGGAFEQEVTVEIAVAVAIRAQDSAKGGKRAVLIEGFQAALEASLAGWRPRPDSQLMDYLGADSAPFGNGLTWWVAVWRTSRWIRK